MPVRVRPSVLTLKALLRRVLFYSGELEIVNYKKIFGIVIASSVLGLVINYFNPNGISLIREKQELNWAPDSIFIESPIDSTDIPTDSSKLISINSEEEKEILEQTVESTSEVENQHVEKEIQNKEPKKVEKIPEVIAFDAPKAVKLEQAFSLYKKGVLFIDARDEADFLAGHISNSVNIPFDDFDNHKQKLKQISKDKPLVVYCAGTDCDLSILLGDLLFDQGYKQVYIFFGGWNEWLDADYPVEHPSEEN